MAFRGSVFFVALGLSIASLVCIFLALLGGLNKDLKLPASLFSFQIDLTTFFANEPEGAYRGIIPGVTNLTVGEIPGTTSENLAFASALWQARGANQLSQFYSVYLWDYCSGDTSVVGSSASCAKYNEHGMFDPFQAMNLSRWTGSQNEDTIYPATLAHGMHVYQKAAAWLRASFIIALIGKFVELALVIIFTTSQWGSLFTAFSSVAVSIFIFIVSLTQSIIWTVIVRSWHESLDSIGVDAYLGKGFLMTVWLSFFFSFSGSLWCLLTMFCSNRRSGPGARRPNWLWTSNVLNIRGYRYNSMWHANPQSRHPQGQPSMSKTASLQAENSHSRSLSEVSVDGQVMKTYEDYRHQAINP